jgi:hypothetical protein
MKVQIKYALSACVIIILTACTATGVKSNADNPTPTVRMGNAQSATGIEKNAKIYSAIDYLEKDISNSSLTQFYNRKRENLPASAKEDFIAMIRNERTRINEFPSGVYVRISGALRNGFINASCNRNGVVDFKCLDFDRFVLLRRNYEMSFDLAQEAGNLNITYSPLAEHYRNGFVVKKNLRTAYDYYKKDGTLRDAQFRNEDIFLMLNSELRQYDSKVNLVRRIDEQTCNTFKAITSANFCSNGDLEKMFDTLSIENIILNSTPLNQADLMGDWIADVPMIVNQRTIKGFDFGKEGIMYASITNGARNLASSFNYGIKNNQLEFDIKFSMAGIPVGSKLVFEGWKTKNGAIVLKSENRFAIYKRAD